MIDSCHLARLLFAITVIFHNIFPPINIGLGLFLVIFSFLLYFFKEPIYSIQLKFWINIYFLNFVFGIISGQFLEFELKNYWINYLNCLNELFNSNIGQIDGYLFALDIALVLFLVFFIDKLKPIIKCFLSLIIFIISFISSAWIIAINSFQQTPSGYSLINGICHINNIYIAVFNPSYIFRLTHIIVAAILIGASLVVSYYSILIYKTNNLMKYFRFLKLSIIIYFAASLIMFFTGHIQAKALAFNQPIKFAAFEGNYISTKITGTKFCIFGLPDENKAKIFYEIAIPDLLSFLVYNNINKPVCALDRYSRSFWPPLFITFIFYRIMILGGLINILLGSFLVYKLFIVKNLDTKIFNKLRFLFVFSIISNFSGWICSESGRQPWIINNILKTVDSLTIPVSFNQFLFQFWLIVCLIIVLFITYIILFYMILKKQINSQL